MAVAPATDEDSPGAAAVRLAEQIKARREGAGLTQPQLAERIGYTAAYVSRVECADRGLPSEGVVAAIDTALGAGGVLVDLRAQARAERDRLRAVHTPPRLTVESELSLTVRVRIPARHHRQCRAGLGVVAARRGSRAQGRNAGRPVISRDPRTGGHTCAAQP